MRPARNRSPVTASQNAGGSPAHPSPQGNDLSAPHSNGNEKVYSRQPSTTIPPPVSRLPAAQSSPRPPASCPHPARNPATSRNPRSLRNLPQPPQPPAAQDKVRTRRSRTRLSGSFSLNLTGESGREVGESGQVMVWEHQGSKAGPEDAARS